MVRISLEKKAIHSTNLKLLVIQTVREILDDPDFGLELTERAKKRLRASRQSNQSGVPFSDVKKGLY